MIVAVIISGFLTFLLGLTIVMHGLEKKSNYYFAIVCLFAASLILIDVLFRYFPLTGILQSAFALAALLPATAMLWASEFLSYSWSYRKKLLLILPAVFLFVASYTDGLIVGTVTQLLKFGYEAQLGPLFGAYTVIVLIYTVVTILLFLLRYRETDAVFKRQIIYILTGVVLYTLAATFFSLILPEYFGYYGLTMLDAPSSLFFVAFSAYAIIRHQFLNVRVIAAELITFGLWLILLIQIFTVDSTQERLLGSVLLGLAIFFGYFLLRSVRKEVETREKLEVLTKQLQSANERLRVLDQQKSEFLSIATHQLRGPLAGIRGYLSLIIDGSYGKIPKKATDVVEKVFESSGMLAQTINDFLNVSRIEQGSMQYDMTDFKTSELVADIADELQPVAKERGLKLTFEDECGETGCMVHADKAKISHIYFNLIDNAIKYTEKGWVKARVFKEGNVVRVEVSDSGVGIEKDEIGVLFEKFVRARGATKVNVNGTGLGLYVARQMVEAHKGKIWAESAGKGKGSTFVVELPLK